MVGCSGGDDGGADTAGGTVPVATLPPVATTVAAAPTVPAATAPAAPSATVGSTAAPVTTARPSTTVATSPPTSAPAATTVTTASTTGTAVATTVTGASAPCVLDVVVEQTETRYEGVTPSDLRCIDGWAAWIGRPDDQFADGFFAVARADGATWELVNLGTAGVCADAGVPAAIWADLGCFE